MPTWLGDAAMATPLIEALRDKFPRARIDFLIKPYLRQLLDNAPWCGHVFELATGAGFWTVRSRIARQRHDWGILLSNSFRPALLMWMAGVRRRIGYVRNGRGPLLTDGVATPESAGQSGPFRMVDYYGAIGDRLDIRAWRQRRPRLYVGHADRQNAAAVLVRFGRAAERPLVAINPGAKYGSAKCWPPAYFARTADALVRRRGVQVLVLAGPGEDELARDIVGRMAEPASALPSAEVDLGTLKALVNRLDLMITNDTGPRHLADAFGVPAVVIFGPTHTVWGDTGYEKSIELAIEVDCGPCMKRVCPLGHHRCMVDLPPDRVVSAAEALLEKYPPRQHPNTQSD